MVLYTSDCSICVLLVVPPKTSTEGSVMATDIEFDKFTLQLNPSLFNDTHGPVVSYAILLTSDLGMIVKIYVRNFFYVGLSFTFCHLCTLCFYLFHHICVIFPTRVIKWRANPIPDQDLFRLDSRTDRHIPSCWSGIPVYKSQLRYDLSGDRRWVSVAGICKRATQCKGDVQVRAPWQTDQNDIGSSDLKTNGDCPL